MAAEYGYATYEARLASFETSVPVPTKKRTSNAKGTKSITWPHKSPSPTELALAGFYYKPSIEAPDNTICYMCERQLDGWEEEDDPVVEHLKHSDTCGWAILMDVTKETHDTANMEDPTQSRIGDARTATFEAGWPHESKRGWVCRAEKMVRAGWHFAPTPESDDFVSCAYCKLSLDGWEPKDNPFDEHHRRSPDCPFFSFAGASAPKAGKGKKSRASKIARFSTQSNVTVASEVPSIPDLNESIDTSTVSVLSTASTMGKGKNARGKAKAARHNKAEEAWGLQPEHSVIILDDEPETFKPLRGKKRTSEQISDDRNDREGTARPEPPAKRRNTRTRNSVVEQVDYPTLDFKPDATEVDSSTTKKLAKVGRKRLSTITRSRKNSGASVASLRAAAPDIAAIEAALEAELDKPLSDEEMALEPVEKPKRGRSKKATALKAATRSKKEVDDVIEVDAKKEVQEVVVEQSVHEEEPGPTKKGRKTTTMKKTTRKRESLESNATAATQIDTVVESSMMTAQTMESDSGHETDASVAGKRTKKGSKRKAPAKGKGKKGLMNKNIEDILHTEPAAEEKMDVSTEIAVLNAEIEAEEAVAKKQAKMKAKKTKKVTENAPHLSMPGAFSPLTFREESMEPSFMSAVASDTPPVRINPGRKVEESQPEIIDIVPEKTITPTPTPRAAPPLPERSPARTATPRRAIPRTIPVSVSVQQASPTPSVQSSDAENAPPSSRPASVRPPLQTLTTTRVQLNPGTPTRIPLSPSRIGGSLRSVIPWSEVDVEMVFNENTPGEEGWMKGGELDEREKGMTVQEWIYENAARAEEGLRMEGERVVGVFEREGTRAMQVLEGIKTV